MRTLVLFAVLLLGTTAFCQSPAPQVTVSAPPKSVQAGAKFTVTVTVRFAEGFHAYQNPPSSEYEIPLTVKIDGKEFKVGKVAYPAGVDASVGGTEKPTKAYQGTIKIPVTLIAPTKIGAKSLKITVAYQQCDETSCFPPDEVVKTLKVNVVKRTGKG